jgi:hypothetical protein
MIPKNSKPLLYGEAERVLHDRYMEAYDHQAYDHVVPFCECGKCGKVFNNEAALVIWLRRVGTHFGKKTRVSFCWDCVLKIVQGVD